MSDTSAKIHPCTFLASSSQYYIMVVGSMTMAQIEVVQQDCMEQPYERRLDIVGRDYERLLKAMEIGESLESDEVPDDDICESSDPDERHRFFYDWWATETPSVDHEVAAVIFEEKVWMDAEFTRLFRKYVPTSLELAAEGKWDDDEFSRDYWVAYDDGRIEVAS